MPRRNVHHVKDNILKYIFNGNICISIQILMKRSDNGLAPTSRQAIFWTNDG